MQHTAHDVNELLQQYLSGRDVPCASCGYNLRNTTSPRCPECGAAISLRVGTPRSRIGGWIITVLSAALPLGFYMTALGIGGYAIWQRDYRLRGNSPGTVSSFDFHVMQFLGIASGVFLVTLLLTLRFRGLIARRSWPVRWIVGLVWCTALLAGHTIALRMLLRRF